MRARCFAHVPFCRGAGASLRSGRVLFCRDLLARPRHRRTDRHRHRTLPNEKRLVERAGLVAIQARFKQPGPDLLCLVSDVAAFLQPADWVWVEPSG